MTYAHDISPDVLTGGEWVLDPRTRVMRWVADPVPTVAQRGPIAGLEALLDELYAERFPDWREVAAASEFRRYAKGGAA